jgi:hypothetical protein
MSIYSTRSEQANHYTNDVMIMHMTIYCFTCADSGADPAHPPPLPPKIGKNMIFWRKIVIFNTKYPNNFRASLRSAQFF